MKKLNMPETRGGGDSGLSRGQEVRRSRSQASLKNVILNLFQDLVIRCEEAKRRRCEASIVKISPLSGAGEKCVGCTPHPVLCTTFSHTVEKEEIDASPFTHHLSLKKRVAFTLAEVLITLGIIGVVAAMTMPSLINKYQMKSYEVAFKKQYSVLQNAINYLVLDSNISACYIFYPRGQMGYSMVKDDCQALQDSLVSQLNLTKIPEIRIIRLLKKLMYLQTAVKL